MFGWVILVKRAASKQSDDKHELNIFFYPITLYTRNDDVIKSISSWLSNFFL